MRASRVIFACACAAIGVVIVISELASPRREPVTLAAPPSIEDVAGGHRESAVLNSAPTPTSSSTREAPPAPGIHGRLTESTTGAPLEGWTIRLRHASEPARVANLSSYPGVRGTTNDDALQLESNWIGRGTRFEAFTATSVRLEWTSGSTTIEPTPTPTLVLPALTAIDAAGPVKIDDALAKDLEAATRALQSTPSQPEPAPQEAASGDSFSSPSTPPDAAESSATPATEVSLLSAFTPNAPAPAPTESGGGLRPSDEAMRGKVTPAIERLIQEGQSDAVRSQLFYALASTRIAESQLHVQRFKTFPVTDLREMSPTCTQAECVTDSDGHFDLPCPECDGAWLQLEPRPPLYPDSTRYPLHEAADACARPIEWKTHVVERALVSARVIDAATGEPVPFLDVALSGDDCDESRITDADGRIASTKLFATGRVRAAFIDGPKAQSDLGELGRSGVTNVHCDQPSVILDASGAEVVFRVAIGPTYRFTLPNGIDPDLVVARVHGLTAKDPKDECALDGAWHPMRKEGEWFVRAPVPVRAAEGVAPSLDVWTSDMHRAHVELSRFEGRGEVRELPLDLGARISGRVLDERGEPVVTARVALIARDATVIDAMTTSMDGSWQFVGVDPGRFSCVEVELDGRSQRASVPLQAGEDRELDVTLDARPH